MNQEKRKYNNHIIVNYSVSYNSRNVIHITYAAEIVNRFPADSLQLPNHLV